MNLKNKTILVTGGAIRIGRAVCRACARAGADVVVHYHTSRSEAEALCSALRDTGVQAWTVQGNLAEEDQCRQLVAAAQNCAGHLDGLVNNAAVFNPDRVTSFVLDRVKQQMNINLYAPMVLVQAFARVCTKGGSVVNMLDRRIVHDDVNYMSYSISKKALAAATRLAALELAPYVTVNAVAPGAVLSPHGSDPSVSPVPAGKVPMQSPCTPEDVANAVLFLLSQGLITGQTVYVDGGQHLLGNDVDG